MDIFEKIVPHLWVRDVTNLRLVSTATRDMVDTISKGAIIQCLFGSEHLYRYLVLRYNDRKIIEPGVNSRLDELRAITLSTTLKEVARMKKSQLLSPTSTRSRLCCDEGLRG